MPTPVDELKARKEADFQVEPGTNEEVALRFLARKPDLGFTPKEIAEDTDIPRASITKTMARLHDKNLVDKVSGTYFVKQERLDEIQGFLGDLYNLRMMAEEPHEPVTHRDQEADTRADREERGYERASEDEVEDVMEDVLDDESEAEEQ